MSHHIILIDPGQNNTQEYLVNFYFNFLDKTEDFTIIGRHP